MTLLVTRECGMSTEQVTTQGYFWTVVSKKKRKEVGRRFGGVLCSAGCEKDHVMCFGRIKAAARFAGALLPYYQPRLSKMDCRGRILTTNTISIPQSNNGTSANETFKKTIP